MSQPTSARSRRWRTLAAAVALGLGPMTRGTPAQQGGGPAHPAQPARAPSTIPPVDTAGDVFMRWLADDTDGSRFVWATFRNVGLAYVYVSVAAFPTVRGFVEVQEPQSGDVAWWPAFMAVCNAQQHSAVTADGEVELAALERRYGRARYYRRLLATGRPVPGVGP